MVGLREKDLLKRYVFSLEWKNVAVMDAEVKNMSDKK